MTRLLIVDDHKSVGLGTKEMLSSFPAFSIHLACKEQEIQEALSIEFDLILMDMHLPGKNGLEWISIVKKRFPKTKIIMFTGLDVESHFNICVQNGADGLISKSCTEEQIRTAVKAALHNQAVIPIEILKNVELKLNDRQSVEDKTLTNREYDILVEMMKEKTNLELAETFFLSQRSIERELTSIYKKVGASTRRQAMERAVELRIVPEILVRSLSRQSV
ncbi:two-component response regulator [Bacillus sp. JCM 19047]|uniref:Response regulator transcription factor n=1 Tax=Shouchella miscanthi TaxID=2598861 RepID=A0ABU6NL85_9BACI|nr:response regulator transcription factor [Shouchella miscanthi]MED4128761.1 response regulator transcription factor [Shouchella miscanthi]GAF20456.1 two-component response regulator [Bacillus sp. JCM 19047]